MTTTEFKTSTKTRIMYSLMSLGVATPAEAVAGIIAFYIVDVKNLPTEWFATFWFFYTIYNAINNPLLGFMSDRTHSRWGRRIPYVLFGGLPYAAAFALLFTAPFDGKDDPLGLLIYFGAAIVIWETCYTAFATGYYGLLPEMFGDYRERTDVAAKMNIFQTVALVLGAAMPPLLADMLGWSGMATVLAVISVIAIYTGYPALFERADLKTDTSFPFMQALRYTFANRSYLTAAGAQMMRFVATGTLQTGILFYLKYSLKVDESLGTVILGIAFLVAMISLYPWRNWVANKLDSRRTLMIANAIMILGIVPMGFSPSINFTYAAAVILGVGLGGLVLIGDIIMAEVVDEDEVKTGHQRAGMYFGMSGFLITLSGLIVSSVFGLVMPAFGYNTLLDVQPPSVDLGFRIFLTVPTSIGFLLAIFLLWLYPLHGKRLAEIKETLKNKRDTISQ
ncbi:MAG TPA: MFS transporter [Anaerolineales bacterium]|nr:MFS transporter [Anaerolineales bacterium]HRK87841.1 MFS transporter [Anaerolineales bacterium]